MLRMAPPNRRLNGRSGLVPGGGRCSNGWISCYYHAL
jgi:hypothetical protein